MHERYVLCPCNCDNQQRRYDRVRSPRPCRSAPVSTQHAKHLLYFRRQLRRITQVLRVLGDRKSTRLNSSHGYISYAVFCLKKKKEEQDPSWPEAIVLRACRPV